MAIDLAINMNVHSFFSSVSIQHGKNVIEWGMYGVLLNRFFFVYFFISLVVSLAHHSNYTPGNILPILEGMCCLQ